MKRRNIIIISVLLFLAIVGCGAAQRPHIGVAFGVGPAARWPLEIEYMKEYAAKHNIDLRVRFNTDEEAKTLEEDCRELIDSGIDVLIVRPRDVNGMTGLVDYAHAHDVQIVSYDSLIEKQQVDLFVGYDSTNTGKMLGKYLSEIVTDGDYIMLWGDSNRNVEDMYAGAMEYIEPLNQHVRVILEAEIPGWSPEVAKQVVTDAVKKNGGNIDAILAFNDKLAGACAEVVQELNVGHPVAIAGMDAELDAVKRMVTGTQSCTAYMDTKNLAEKAVEQAVYLARGQEPQANTEIDTGDKRAIPAYLLTRKLVTPENLDRVLIDSGIYTRQEVYGG